MARYEELKPDISDDASESDETIFYQHPRRQIWKARLIPCLTFILGFLTASSIVLIYWRSMPPTQEPSCMTPPEHSHKLPHTHQPEVDISPHCGKSREEAIALGCTLDVMGDAWLPPACYDSSAAAKALSPDTRLARLGGAGPFPWFLDKNFTQPITQDDLQTLGEQPGYTWETYHVAHCLYDWQMAIRQINRAIKGEEPVFLYPRALEEEHVAHCGVVIADQKRRIGAKAVVKFGFGECLRIDGVLRTQV